MATGATGQLGLALPVQGELSGTWGDTVNNGITQYTNIAIAGTLTLTGDGAVTLANTTGDASASNITSTLTGAGTVTAQFAIVRVTGTLTVAKVVTGPSYSKTYTVVNAATGGIVTFKASGQTGISIAVGETAFVYFNGTDYVKVAGTTSGAAAGSTTQVQYNSSGVLAGSANLTFNGTTLTANTIGAFTLSGTIAGGGNQINNVIIGTTTPLAGAFTTLSATNNATIYDATLNTPRVLNLIANRTTAGTLGTLNFGNAQFDSAEASIVAAIDASIDDARLSFNTSPTGGALTERFRFGSLGQFGIGGANYGTSGQVLTSGGSAAAPTWTTVSSGSGDVVGPASATNNGIALFNSTTGKLIKDSAASDGLIYGLTVGRGAGAVATNTAVGLQSLNANTTGNVNTSVGYAAMQSNTTGAAISAFGYLAAQQNTTGGQNTAIGNEALRFNTTAGYSTAVGYQAAYSLNGAFGYTTAIGNQALYSQTSGYSNTAVGYQSGYLMTTGIQNSMVGIESLKSNTTGNGNSAFGVYALNANTTASNNTAVGMEALYLNTTGTNHVSVGYQALRANTTANSNTAIGYQAMYSNTTSTLNVAVGYQALYTNTTGTGYNTAVGYEAMKFFNPGNAARNAAFGFQALSATTSGAGNTAVGAGALRSNTTGTANVAVGSEDGIGNWGATLAANTTGARNIGIGTNLLGANTTGGSNIGIGTQALAGNTTGGANIAIGAPGGQLGAGPLASNSTGTGNIALGNECLASNTTANYNIGIGINALYRNTTGEQNAGIGFYSLSAITTGSYNTALGVETLKSVTTATSNTALGGYAGLNITTGVENVMLGYDAGTSGAPGGSITTQSNRIVVGSGRMTNAYIQIAWTVTSDARDKTDVVDTKYGLDFVNELRPVEYKWDKRLRYEDKTPNGAHKEIKSQLGFLAQDVIALEKKYGATAKDLLIADDENDDLYSITETKMIPVLVKAIQEQQVIIESLKARLDAANL